MGELPPLWEASLRFWCAAALIGLWCAVWLGQRGGTLKSGLCR